jgi:hypothetical protein
MQKEMARLTGVKLGPFAADLCTESEGSEARYAILGLDFLFSSQPPAATTGAADDEVQGWLLECNCTPCLYGSAQFSNVIKQSLAEDVIETFVGPAEEGMRTGEQGGELLSLRSLPVVANGKFTACNF